MATPSLHTQVVGTQTSTVTFTNTTDVAAGDLLIVVWGSTVKAAGAITATATANSGAQTVATLTADSNIDDGTKQIYVFSGVVTASPTTAVTITLTGAPTTGTRRLFVQSVNPGTGQRWSTNRFQRSGTATGTTGTTSWTLGWGSAGASSQPEYGFAAIQWAATQNPTIDLGDGSATSSTYPGSSSVLFHIKTAGYGTNTLQSVSNVTVSTGGNSSHVAQAALYVVSDPAQARGNSAAKGSARYTLIHTAQARGKSAAKGTGAGYKYATTKTSSARGNSASKGTATPHPKTASGVARTAATGSTTWWTHVAPSSGRGKNAAKGTARWLKRSVSSGRGNAASKASGTFKITRIATGPGRSAASSNARYTAIHRSIGPGRSAASGTARGIRRIMRSGKGFAAGTGTARFYTTVPATTLVLDQTSTLTTTGPDTTLTLDQTTTLTVDQTSTVTVPQGDTVTI